MADASKNRGGRVPTFTKRYQMKGCLAEIDANRLAAYR